MTVASVDRRASQDPSPPAPRPVLRPFGDRLVIAPLVETEERVGSLYVPPGAQDTPVMGRVVDQGPVVGLNLIGQIVVFGRYAGTTVRIDRDEWYILRFDDLLATLITDPEEWAGSPRSDATPPAREEREDEARICSTI